MKTISLKQRGVVILEALIAILIFSIGILGLIAMYANSQTQAGDAQYRIEATNHANQLMNEIWISADRWPDDTNLFNTIQSFGFNANGGACVFNGGFAVAPGNAAVTALLGRLTAAGTGLPGSGAPQLQVLVTDAAQNHQVQITICWQTPTDRANGEFRRQVLVANVS